MSAVGESAGVNPALVRAYDLRGRVGDALREQDAHALGLVYATHARAQGLRRVAVGRDGRESSPLLEQALVAGLVAGGMHVQRVGLGPTPLLYFAVHELALDGGIMVTGSHNPPDENGFKLLLGREPVHGAALAALVATEPRPARGGDASALDLTERYVERLAATLDGCAVGRIAWDCGNGATGEVVTRLAARLPGTHELLNAAIDGRFPAHHPDPSVPENLRELQAHVVEHGCDCGIAFDGDGDRIGVVDDGGAIVWPDQLLLLLAADVLTRHPGAAVVADVKSSRVLFDGLERLGARAVMAPSGYVRLRERMLQEDAPLAGEMSGHVFFRDDWYGTDDALHVAMRTLRALAHSGHSLAAFRAALPVTAATPELRLACPAGAAGGVIEALAARLAGTGLRVDRTDGLRVTGEDGWWLVRASGTEAKLTVRCEARDAAGLRRLREDLAHELRECGVEPAALEG